jgi:hypothetical protein
MNDVCIKKLGLKVYQFSSGPKFDPAQTAIDRLESGALEFRDVSLTIGLSRGKKYRSE